MTDVDRRAYPLDNAEEVLLRQVHPHFLDAKGEVMRVAFAPAHPREEGLLSTRREEVGPEIAFAEWTGARGSGASVGTWGVSVGDAAGAELPCFDDSHMPEYPAYHATVDFSDHEHARHKQLSRKIWQAAVARGCLFRPSDN
ncbi:hypothetical protein [Occultella kanbiaonis]|uniref:hypothetical protein n=1 Tax=Occultella kanbiaonis TaxID=2675754 RepID=UPI0013D5B914|nr:hypothetical protein [Occultella kanbiaonis]